MDKRPPARMRVPGPEIVFRRSQTPRSRVRGIGLLGDPRCNRRGESSARNHGFGTHSVPRLDSTPYRRTVIAWNRSPRAGSSVAGCWAVTEALGVLLVAS